jgi:DNA-directed RNA polymerase specialized sigma24 family protein/CheY-like chemotaxis protein
MASRIADRRGVPGTGLSASDLFGLKQEIVRHLPYLRRYARALTGSQRMGDDYIRGSLEALLEQPGALTEGSSNVRLQLFRLFHRFARVVETSTVELAACADPMDRQVGERLVALEPRDRQALLLVHQEGFTPAQAAEILDVDEVEVVRRIRRAWTELKRQPVTDVLIIEDEPVIALDVAETVKSLNHRVCGIVSRANQAVDSARISPPGLVLADIELEDGSTGISAVREILKSNDVPVVFVTAFPERLMDPDTPEATLVVAKPFDPAALKVAISQALFFGRAS